MPTRPILKKSAGLPQRRGVKSDMFPYKVYSTGWQSFKQLYVDFLTPLYTVPDKRRECPGRSRHRTCSL